MKRLKYRLETSAVKEGFDGVKCLTHCRTGLLPSGNGKRVLMTASPLLLSGCDVFDSVHTAILENGSWSDFLPVPGLDERREGEKRTVIANLVPEYHQKTKTLLATGSSISYLSDEAPNDEKNIAYAVWNNLENRWNDWENLKLPDNGRDYRQSDAGSGQRTDLPDGTVLLPFSRWENGKAVCSVARCSFDGQKLNCQECGNELEFQNGNRGLYEPSLTSFRNRFFMTMRSDEYGFVSSSDDGLSFSTPCRWSWDNGVILPTYNTQQHFVTHPEGLFLVYTRIAETNGHVFRHRAPLFMAQIDTERLCLLRDTETIVIPERGARLGNFGVTVTEKDEAWITVSEWMQPEGCEKHGSDNSVWIARIFWDE